MCLGIPGQVVDVVDPGQHLATVDVSGVQRTISVRLLADVGLRVGDWVLVHVGFALARIDEAEAAATLAELASLGKDFYEELRAFAGSEVSTGPGGTDPLGEGVR